MTKADLVSAMAKASGGSKVSAERALDAFFVSVFDAKFFGECAVVPEPRSSEFGSGIQ